MERSNPMVARKSDNGRTPEGDRMTTSLWAYGYELAPPVARTRLKGMQAILDAGHMEARTRTQVWEGRFINGDHITHILVVSGTPAQNGTINRRLEAELNRLEAPFSLSTPVEVPHDPRRHPGWGRLPPGTGS